MNTLRLILYNDLLAFNSCSFYESKACGDASVGRTKWKSWWLFPRSRINFLSPILLPSAQLDNILAKNMDPCNMFYLFKKDPQTIIGKHMNRLEKRRGTWALYSQRCSAFPSARSWLERIASEERWQTKLSSASRSRSLPLSVQQVLWRK